MTGLRGFSEGLVLSDRAGGRFDFEELLSVMRTERIAQYPSVSQVEVQIYVATKMVGEH